MRVHRWPCWHLENSDRASQLQVIDSFPWTWCSQLESVMRKWIQQKNTKRFLPVHWGIRPSGRNLYQMSDSSKCSTDLQLRFLEWKFLMTHDIQVQNNFVDAHFIICSMYHRVLPASWMASLFNSRNQWLQCSDAQTTKIFASAKGRNENWITTSALNHPGNCYLSPISCWNLHATAKFWSLPLLKVPVAH